MNRQQWIGALLVSGALGVLIPYTGLTIVFDYPDILRQDPGRILAQFRAGGEGLIGLWWSFAVLGLPLLVATVQLGQRWEQHYAPVRWATTLGVAGLLAQMVGLLRWSFVVPVLAETYATGNEASRAAAEVGFQLIHQYGGVVLGEHLGQMFTIIWTVVMVFTFDRFRATPRWMGALGLVASLIYAWAQTELFHTVLPDFPLVDWAGLVGSSLWLLWLICVGVYWIGTPTQNAFE